MSSIDYIHPSDIEGGRLTPKWHIARSLNPPMHPAAMGRAMPLYYVSSDQRVIKRVSRPPHLSPPLDTLPPITFSVNGWAGVCFEDVMEGTVMIDAANDSVLAEHGWRSIVVNLEWPGYESRNFADPMRSRIDVRPSGTDITRQYLAREICGLLSSFHMAVSRSSIPAGPQGIRVHDIFLLSLHFYRTVWVPEFYVAE